MAALGYTAQARDKPACVRRRPLPIKMVYIAHLQWVRMEFSIITEQCTCIYCIKISVPNFTCINYTAKQLISQHNNIYPHMGQTVVWSSTTGFIFMCNNVCAEAVWPISISGYEHRHTTNLFSLTFTSFLSRLAWILPGPHRKSVGSARPKVACTTSELSARAMELQKYPGKLGT